MLKNLSRISKVSKNVPYTADGTGDINGASVDTKGLSSATFIGCFGTVASASLKVQGSDDGTTGWADVAGAVATPPEADGIAVVECDAPGKRYLRAVVVRGGVSGVDAVMCLQHRSVNEPVVQASNVGRAYVLAGDTV